MTTYTKEELDNCVAANSGAYLAQVPPLYAHSVPVETIESIKKTIEDSGYSVILCGQLRRKDLEECRENIVYMPVAVVKKCA